MKKDAHKLTALLALLLITGCVGEAPGEVVPYDATVLVSKIPEVIEALKSGDPLEAIVALDRRRAAGDLPDGAKHYQALALQDLKRTEEAEILWRQEITEHPGNGAAHAFLAEILIDSGTFKEAGALLDQAQRYQPGMAISALLRGRLARQQGKDQDAVRHYNDFLMLEPFEARAIEAHRAIGQIMATENYDPTSAQWHEERAAYLTRVHQYRAVYRQRLAQRPSDVDALYGIGMTWLNLFYEISRKDQSLLEEADRWLTQVLLLAPDHAEALANLASIRAEQRRTEDAIALFQRAVEIDPNEPRPHLRLGRLYLMTQKLGEAETETRAALTASTKNQDRAMAHSQLAEILQHSNPAGAIENLQIYLNFEPNDPAQQRSLLEQLLKTQNRSQEDQ